MSPTDGAADPARQPPPAAPVDAAAGEAEPGSPYPIDPSRAGEPTPTGQVRAHDEPAVAETESSLSAPPAGGERDGSTPLPPPIADGSERMLSPAVARLWFLSGSLRAFFWAGGAAALAFAMPDARDWWPASFAVLAALVAWSAQWSRLRYRSWSFRVRETELVVQRGVLWRVVSVIPHARIQHVDTRHGPIERWLGLASVVVFTAGVRGADVTIPGLRGDDAVALREHLARVGVSEDAV